jgi:F-type H+-transporting ATPase subunit b
MMGNFLFLATAESGGVSLNPDLIEANLFNLVVVLGFVFVFGRKLLTDILTERRLAIETAIQEAEASQKQAMSALEVAKQNLAQAQTEAENIRKTAVTSAENAKAEIAAKAAADIERMQELAAAETKPSPNCACVSPNWQWKERKLNSKTCSPIPLKPSWLIAASHWSEVNNER